MSSSRQSITVEHRYRHPPARVWRALTEPALLAQWWAKGDIKAEVGHRFELDMGAFGQQPCEVLEVDVERRLAFRFAPATLDTVITWELFADGEGTRLVLTHSGFDVSSPLGRRAFDGMKPGWPGVLARLAAALDA